MGFLSKKQFTCKRCGKTFEARLSSDLCDECRSKEYELQEDVDGYRTYASKYLGKKLNDYNEMLAAQEHRDQILSKYALKRTITEEQLREISANYQTIGEEKAVAAYRRVSEGMVSSALCCYYTDHFFIPYDFKKSVVDAASVIAIAADIVEISSSSTGAGDVLSAGMSTLIGQAMGFNVFFLAGSHTTTVEIVRCVLFADDPYLPAFAIGFPYTNDGKKVKRRDKEAVLERIVSVISGMCPNLQYSVQGLKDFKKLIKKEQAVKGSSIDSKTMLQLISDADKLFDCANQKEQLPDATADMLKQRGYFMDYDVEQILRLDKGKNKKYWENIFRKAAEEEANYIRDDYYDEPPAITREPDEPVTAGAEEAIPAAAGEAQPMIWFCPNCGNKNEGRFCAHCGTPKP